MGRVAPRLRFVQSNGEEFFEDAEGLPPFMTRVEDHRLPSMYAGAVAGVAIQAKIVFRRMLVSLSRGGSELMYIQEDPKFQRDAAMSGRLGRELRIRELKTLTEPELFQFLGEEPSMQAYEARARSERRARLVKLDEALKGSFDEDE